MNYQSPERRRALAADYAIGLMPPTARRHFERLLDEDPELRKDLARWQDVLATLTDTLPEEPVPDHVWQAIVARIDPQRLHVPAKRPLWTGPRMAALAAVLVLAVGVGLALRPEHAQYATTLVSANEQPALRLQAFNGYLELDPLSLDAMAKDKSLELWAIPAGGKPVSLGVMPTLGKGRMKLTERQQALLGAAVTMAVTLEPAGGSPTGDPTGPVVYHGQLASL